MILYHYTHMLHYRRIERNGFLRRTESNVSPVVEHAGPPVLWLTSDRTLSLGDHGTGATSITEATGMKPDPDWDKTRIRITVDVPDAVRWLDWEPGKAMNDLWRDVIIVAGGGIEAAGTWYVCERNVYAKEWIAVDDLRE